MALSWHPYIYYVLYQKKEQPASYNTQQPLLTQELRFRCHGKTNSSELWWWSNLFLVDYLWRIQLWSSKLELVSSLVNHCSLSDSSILLCAFYEGYRRCSRLYGYVHKCLLYVSPPIVYLAFTRNTSLSCFFILSYATFMDNSTKRLNTNKPWIQLYLFSSYLQF